MRCELVLGCCLLGVAIGCGDPGLPAAPPPPPPVHSPSFFPVRGTDDAGLPADQLEWVYAMNGGAPVPLNSTGGVTVSYADHHVGVAGTTLTKSLNGTVASTDGSGWAGTVSEQTTDHLSSDSPAAVLSRELVDTSSVRTARSPLTYTHLVNMYDFAAMPEPTLFDRTDLDTLAIGFSESVNTVATDNWTETGTGTLAGTQGVGRSLSWSLQAVMPTFQVLGKEYANVVQVEEVVTTTTTAGDPPQGTITSTLWLAKGIGMIRAQTTGIVASGVVETDTFELASTNLVAP
jgi:hypothetical protein